MRDEHTQTKTSTLVNLYLFFPAKIIQSVQNFIYIYILYIYIYHKKSNKEALSLIIQQAKIHKTQNFDYSNIPLRVEQSIWLVSERFSKSLAPPFWLLGPCL